MAKKKQIAYVVVEVGYEYNDEIYSQSESGGNPRGIYLTEEAAKEAAVRRSAEKMKIINPFEYGYGLDEISSLFEKEMEKKMSDILDADIQIGFGNLKINCRGDNHRLYQAIGEDCPCQPSSGRWDPPWPRGATIEQLEQLSVEVFDQLSFYHVQEVDIEEGELVNG